MISVNYAAEGFMFNLRKSSNLAEPGGPGRVPVLGCS
jgi:hypothetical protein